ncbi:MAG: hypothetical protein ACJ796_08555 [Gemmatimonadaceae bacterium]
MSMYRSLVPTTTRFVRQTWLPVIAVLTIGCGSSSDILDRIAGHRASPFALFGRDDMRAGLRFDVLREAAKNESPKQYECVPLWSKAQRCVIAIENGTLVAILDSTNRVIRLMAASDPMVRLGANVHGQLILRDDVRDMRAAWDSVASLRRDDADPRAPQLLWLDRTRRWGATIWYSRARRAEVPAASLPASNAELAMTVPESLGVTDLPAYALFAQLRPAPKATPVVHPLRAPSLGPPTAEELLTMLRSDLRALTAAEESAVHRTGRYETDVEKLDLTPSEDVQLELVQATEDGWSAVATHPRLPAVSCVVYAGEIASHPATRKEGRHGAAGEVVCDRP